MPIPNPGDAFYSGLRGKGERRAVLFVLGIGKMEYNDPQIFRVSYMIIDKTWGLAITHTYMREDETFGLMCEKL